MHVVLKSTQRLVLITKPATASIFQLLTNNKKNSERCEYSEEAHRNPDVLLPSSRDQFIQLQFELCQQYVS